MWHKNSWKALVSEQMPVYHSSKKAWHALQKLERAKPLISLQEVVELQELLVAAEEGNSFILQLGECAESFKNAGNSQYLKNYYDLIQAVKKILGTSSGLPVVTIGRLAGQYAKPRSTLFEAHNEETLMSFRGEIINGVAANLRSRTPNPYRMLLAYLATQNTLQHIKHNLQNNPYDNRGSRYNFLFTSHEALLLDYESAFTKKIDDKYYNLGAHMLWVGARTNSLKDAHIEYLRGVHNPIGIKVYPGMDIKELIAAIKILNPHNKKGRIILIMRLGALNTNQELPSFIKAVKAHQLNVNWMCDPMHGNTKTINNIKTRYFADILNEIISFFNIIRSSGIKAGGIHLEAAQTYVTECVGGITNPINEADLTKKYISLCDPRLNNQQTLDLINAVAPYI